MEGLVVDGSNPYEHDEDIAKGVDRCPKCGGKAQVEKNRKQQVNRYRIKCLEEDLKQQAESGQIKDLRSEVGLSRALLQRLLNTLGEAINSPTIFAYSSQLERMIARIESLVLSCQKLEEKTGNNLTVEEAVQYAQRLAAVIDKFVPEDQKEQAYLELETQLK
jgi:AraC-like DNA-binding protein